MVDSTDEQIEAAVRTADPMVLRSLVYQLTGDESLARTETQEVVFGFLPIQSVTDPQDLELIQTKAIEFLKAHRDRGAPSIDIGPAERLPRSISLAAGSEISGLQLELWQETMALDPWARAVPWRQRPSEAALAEFSVAVIGAGMGGLNAAVHLERSGISYTVLEKDLGVGGTWNQNRYPGARVDTPSRGYVNTYGATFPFPGPFSERHVNEAYFNWVADEFDLRKNIRFGTEVRSVVWDEADRLWTVTAVGPDGPLELRANAIISAVGFLSRPAVPEFPGADSFQGRSFHTSQWPEDLDVTGKRVAVIGSGASGYQLVPALAGTAGHTTLVQRTPNWVYDVPGYLSPFPPELLWLEKNFPYFLNFARFRGAWMFGPEGLGQAFEVDPEFEDPHTRSPLNKLIRDQRVEFLRQKFDGRPELFEAMLPTAPPMSTRPILVDSDYSICDALVREDVSLVQGSIERVVPDGFVTADGTHHQVDVLVYATGFRANDYLYPMEVRGAGGTTPAELWAQDGARAYLGTMLPGFPNFFVIFGPNSAPTGGLNVVDIQEIQLRFALECLHGLIESGQRAVEVDEAGYRTYNAEIDRREATRTYLDKRANTYYTNEFDRSAVNFPMDGRLLWNWTRSPAQRRADIPELAGVKPYFGGDLTTS
ncbi:flavin-containing monooxygenase [Nocardia harenae]|uniref:flavin-containing monooxygenase n=1 Tax=Nocardia harenae TaxID=358707 RepID=UPI001FDF730E|nr:NAD(P)/FAD-dependent oxidoreductase [Nocardia harenae]